MLQPVNGIRSWKSFMKRFPRFCRMPYCVSTTSQFMYTKWTFPSSAFALSSSLPTYFIVAVFPVPVFPNNSMFEGRCPSRAVTSIEAS